MMRLYEFKELNRSKGLHWFDQSTIRFFGSRVSNWDPISGLFISSEARPFGPRMYSVRKANFETGQVSTIGDFCAYKTLSQAKSALRRAQRGEL